MFTRSWSTRRAAATLVVAAIVLVTAVIPGWCVATGMWW